MRYVSSVVRHLSAISFALAATACTQQPAEIVLLGQQEFSKGQSGRGFAAMAPAAGESTVTVAPSRSVDQSTSGTVTVGSVGVSDLPPPAPKPESKAETKPETKRAAPEKLAERPPEKAAPAKPGEVALFKPAPTQVKSAQGFIWPVAGKVISKFGPTGRGKANDGISIAAASGEPVYASADGEVVFVGDQLKGYGNMVLLKHAAGRHTTYAHLNRAGVARYDRVKQGDIIGYVGASGNVKQPQLYFALREGTRAVNPEQYLSSDYAALR